MCLCYTSISGRWIIHRYILSCEYFCVNEQIIHHSGIGIFCPKNTNFSPEETVLHNAVAEFDGANLVYEFSMTHSNKREHVVQELKTYGYTRKGGIGDIRKGGIGS